jgi:hypothetical protein
VGCDEISGRSSSAIMIHTGVGVGNIQDRDKTRLRVSALGDLEADW